MDDGWQQRVTLAHGGTVLVAILEGADSEQGPKQVAPADSGPNAKQAAPANPGQSPREATPTPLPLAPWYLKLAIAAYLVVLIWGITRTVLRLWVGDTSWILDGLGLTPAMFGNPRVVSFLFALTGGGLGAIILSILFFYQHASSLNDFRTTHAWGYLLSPWVGAALGCVIFALVQGGLLIFAAASTPRDADVANLGYFGLGFLVGFGWERVANKLREMVDNVFAGPKDGKNTNQRPAHPRRGPDR